MYEILRINPNEAQQLAIIKLNNHFISEVKNKNIFK